MTEDALSELLQRSCTGRSAIICNSNDKACSLLESLPAMHQSLPGRDDLGKLVCPPLVLAALHLQMGYHK